MNLGALLIAVEAPSSVTGLTAQNVGDGHSVLLQWDPSPDIDVIGYEIWMAEDNGPAMLYDSSYVSIDTVINLVENTLYHFGVAAITADGGRSIIDEFVSITPHSIPLPAENMTITPELFQLEIQWEAEEELDFSHFQIYRRIGQQGDFEPHAQVTDTTRFLDDNLNSNIRYYYYVTQVDTTDLESDPSNVDYSKVLSFDSGILFVDETRDYNGTQGLPTDAQQDSFFTYISEDYPVTFYDYFAEGLLRINDFGAYSTIVWIDDDANSINLHFADAELSKYIDLGGNLFFAGWRSFYGYSLQRPYIFSSNDYPYEYLGLHYVNSTNDADFAGATGLDGWPDLTLVEERIIPNWNGNLIGVDIMGTFVDMTEIYTFNSAIGDTTFDGHPVGIIVDNGDNSIIHLTFPLYPAGDDNAREIFVKAMDYFGEVQTGIDDFIKNEEIAIAILSQNFPNPFNAETRIRFTLRQSSEIQLVIYNILGQEMETLADGEYPAGTHFVNWGNDEIPSGVYFYRLITDNGSISRRMTLLR